MIRPNRDKDEMQGKVTPSGSGLTERLELPSNVMWPY